MSDVQLFPLFLPYCSHRVRRLERRARSNRSGLLIYLGVLEISQGSNVGTLRSRSSAGVSPLQSCS